MPSTKPIAAAALILATLLLAVAVAFYYLMARAADPAWRPGRDGAAALALRGTLPVLVLSGTPAERGAQAGRLVGGQAADLRTMMRLAVQLNPIADHARIAASLAAIAPEDRAEIAACATAAGIPPAELLGIHAIIETMCSAVVRVDDAGVRLGRNMDFAPPGTLGTATLVMVAREPGRRAYANLGWPGMTGVISGINDAGLTACILLNWWGTSPPPGEPLPLTVRRILQTCATVEEAATAFAAATPGSRHYVLLADARQAALVWREADGVHREDPADGWLVVDNHRRQPLGNRARRLAEEAARTGGSPDDDWFRSATTASFMPIDNAQAMTFTPAQRRFALARAVGAVPAALRPWVAVDLGAVLDGAGPEAAIVTPLPEARRLRHYCLEN